MWIYVNLNVNKLNKTYIFILKEFKIFGLLITHFVKIAFICKLKDHTVQTY